MAAPWSPMKEPPVPLQGWHLLEREDQWVNYLDGVEQCRVNREEWQRIPRA